MEFTFPINFVARRMAQHAFGGMSLQTEKGLCVFETELANVDAVQLGEFLWIRREVPRTDLIPS
jgi:hypothetical protein